jgi:hypothetical protein
MQARSPQSNELHLAWLSFRESVYKLVLVSFVLTTDLQQRLEQEQGGPPET